MLALAMVISILFGCNAYIASAATSGNCGATISDKCTWKYDSATTTLTISGTGAVKDYGVSTTVISSKKLPWHDYRHQITKVVVEEGITKIGQLNFYNCGTGRLPVKQNLPVPQWEKFSMPVQMRVVI